MTRRAGWLFAAMTLLGACAPMPVKQEAMPDAVAMAAQSTREAALAKTSDWTLTGRIAVSDGSHGGSGRIEWRQTAGGFDIRLTAPVTGQGWWLSEKDGHARLDGLANGPQEGEDAEALLLEATGWRIPLASLAFWIRGARASGESTLQFDPQGLPSTLSQSGWRIEYRAWDGGDPPRPTRLFVQQDRASVRLQVDHWDGP